jgi:hypothetical protein
MPGRIEARMRRPPYVSANVRPRTYVYPVHPRQRWGTDGGRVLNRFGEDHSGAESRTAPKAGLETRSRRGRLPHKPSYARLTRAPSADSGYPYRYLP